MNVALKSMVDIPVLAYVHAVEHLGKLAPDFLAWQFCQKFETCKKFVKIVKKKNFFSTSTSCFPHEIVSLSTRLHKIECQIISPIHKCVQLNPIDLESRVFLLPDPNSIR